MQTLNKGGIFSFYPPLASRQKVGAVFGFILGTAFLLFNLFFIVSAIVMLTLNHQMVFLLFGVGLITLGIASLVWQLASLYSHLINWNASFQGSQNLDQVPLVNQNEQNAESANNGDKLDGKDSYIFPWVTQDQVWPHKRVGVFALVMYTVAAASLFAAILQGVLILPGVIHSWLFSLGSLIISMMPGLFIVSPVTLVLAIGLAGIPTYIMLRHKIDFFSMFRYSPSEKNSIYPSLLRLALAFFGRIFFNVIPVFLLCVYGFEGMMNAVLINMTWSMVFAYSASLLLGVGLFIIGMTLAKHKTMDPSSQQRMMYLSYTLLLAAALFASAAFCGFFFVGMSSVIPFVVDSVVMLIAASILILRQTFYRLDVKGLDTDDTEREYHSLLNPKDGHSFINILHFCLTQGDPLPSSEKKEILLNVDGNESNCSGNK